MTTATPEQRGNLDPGLAAQPGEEGMVLAPGEGGLASRPDALVPKPHPDGKPYDRPMSGAPLENPNAPAIVFYEPCIAGNTGAVIRLAAVVGTSFHLIEPLGFDFDEKKVKRAGLDYHDLTNTIIHPSFEAFLDSIAPDARIFAFSSHSSVPYTEPTYTPSDFLLFGSEPSGLPEAIVNHPRVTARVRIPMRPEVRSLNLANAASIATYEAWRQLAFPGAV